jgi:hypothetical protein
MMFRLSFSAIAPFSHHKGGAKTVPDSLCPRSTPQWCGVKVYLMSREQFPLPEEAEKK